MLVVKTGQARDRWWSLGLLVAYGSLAGFFTFEAYLGALNTTATIFAGMMVQTFADGLQAVLEDWRAYRREQRRKNAEVEAR